MILLAIHFTAGGKEMQILLLTLSIVIVIELYLAQRPTTSRPEIFYAMAALTLFAAFLTVSHLL